MRCVRSVAMSASIKLIAGAVIAAALSPWMFTPTARACPLCDAPSLTFSEQIRDARIALIGQRTTSTPATETAAETVSFATTDAIKAADGLDEVTIVGQEVDGEAGDLFLITASKPDEFEHAAATQESDNEPKWSRPVLLSPAAAAYLRTAPDAEDPIGSRLGYYVPFLEHDDTTIAIDAYSEFAKAPYDDVIPLAKQIDTTKLRRWLTDEKTTPTRLGLYGLMLGIAGDADDAALMRSIIGRETEELRLGLAGIIGGYLLITGEDGLEYLERELLVSTERPVSENIDAMKAIRFVHQFEKTRIDHDRLKQAMRLVLERPDLADLAIADLTRWKDWSLIPSLVGYFEQPGYDNSSVRRDIIRYYIAAAKTEIEPPSDSQRAEAEAKLAVLKRKYPRLYTSAKRVFFFD